MPIREIRFEVSRHSSERPPHESDNPRRPVRIAFVPDGFKDFQVVMARIWVVPLDTRDSLDAESILRVAVAPQDVHRQRLEPAAVVPWTFILPPHTGHGIFPMAELNHRWFFALPGWGVKCFSGTRFFPPSWPKNWFLCRISHFHCMSIHFHNEKRYFYANDAHGVARSCKRNRGRPRVQWQPQRAQLQAQRCVRVCVQMGKQAGAAAFGSVARYRLTHEPQGRRRR